MSAPVLTITANTRVDLEVKVQREIARGWCLVDGVRELLFDGKVRPDRPRWAQSMRRT
jgi:hypothetical protein